MSQLSADSVPTRRASASLSRLTPVEGVMVAFDAGVYVRLNESAMFVWEQIDGRRSVGEIATALAKRFALGAPAAIEDAHACLARFVELEVVDV